MPAFVSMVELAGMSFAGEPAKSKKQAEKNAAMVAWASLKQRELKLTFFAVHNKIAVFCLSS